MQVGVDNNFDSHSAASSSNAGISRSSIGQRIKEFAKDHVHNVQKSIINTDAGCEDTDDLYNLEISSCINNNNNNLNVTNGKSIKGTVFSAKNGDVGTSLKDVTNSKKTAKKKTLSMLSDVQRNTIRVIGQYLKDLGMNDTVDSLVEESGCRIENTLATFLQDYVLIGAWNQALEVVERFKASISERQYLAIRVLLLEERFKMLISKNEYLAALHLLQADYPKIDKFKQRCEYLATTLITLPILTSETCESGGFVAYEQATQSNLFSNSETNENGATLENKKSNEAVLKILRKMLPPSFLLPPNRLDELLRQSWLYQLKECELHLGKTSDENIDGTSILKNHQCTSRDFPSKNIQVLHDHLAEVWCLEFSPCGQYLASGAKNNFIMIWRIDEKTMKLNLLYRIPLPVEVSGVACLSWSYDSSYLAATSSEENTSGVFVISMERGGIYSHIKPQHDDTYSVVSFFKNESYRLACGDQRGHFSAFDILQYDRNLLKIFEGFRIRCLYSMKDGKTVLAADTHNRIRSYDFDSNTETTIIQETSQIMYFTVDHNEKYCLITTKTEGIKLWSLKTKNLIRSFYGSSHHEFVISSSFGGYSDNFIVSGSEDESIVVWNISKSEPVTQLLGHTGTVNAVSWNPVYHGVLASASDDQTIRLWTTKNRFK